MPKMSSAQGKATARGSPQRLTSLQPPRNNTVSSTSIVRVPNGIPVPGDLGFRAGARWSGRERFSLRLRRPASLASLIFMPFHDKFPNGFRNMTTNGVKGEEFPNSANSEVNIPEVAHAEKGPPRELSDDEEGEVTDVDEFTSLEDTHISSKDYHPGDVYPRPMHIFAYSRHRDGSIYSGTNGWKKKFIVLQIVMKAMKLSDPNEDCKFEDGKCIMHSPRCMLQIFSLKLANIPMDGGSVELYGYMAARDILDPLLNYVIKFCRDKPIIVQQGSLIGMTGPKRGIELYDTTLIEYDMRIKTGEHEKDDLQLIDGVSMVDDLDMPYNPFTRRIHGSCGAVDITLSQLDEAVEATVEVIISEVCSSFNLSLSCFISGLSEEIRLFDGTVGASCGLKRRSVVAVVMDTWMDLKFKVGSGPASFSGNVEHCCSFRASNHGFTSQQIKVGFASISVKVTWSTLSYSAEYKIL